VQALGLGLRVKVWNLGVRNVYNGLLDPRVVWDMFYIFLSRSELAHSRVNLEELLKITDPKVHEENNQLVECRFGREPRLTIVDSFDTRLL
jgi:hypothetical protein